MNPIRIIIAWTAYSCAVMAFVYFIAGYDAHYFSERVGPNQYMSDAGQVWSWEGLTAFYGIVYGFPLWVIGSALFVGLPCLLFSDREAGRRTPRTSQPRYTNCPR